MSELPPGWAWATLAHVIGPGGVFSDGDWVETKDQDPAGGVRLTQLADVGDGTFRDRSSRFLREDQAAALNCTFLEAGDVLIARMPDPLGRACVFPGLAQRAVTAVDVCIVRPGPDAVDARWLMWTVNAPQFRSRVADLQTGTTRRRISRKNLATIQLPVPPLNEQRRIVAAIEEQLSRLDAADVSLAAASRRLDALRSATLETVAPGDAPRHAISDLVAAGRKVAYGVLQPGPHVDGGVPFVRVGDLDGGRVSSDLKRVSESVAGSYPRTKLHGGEVLLSLVGTIGRAAVAPASLRGANVARAVAVIPLNDNLSPEYVALALGRPSATRHLNSLAHEVARKTLNLEDVRRFQIPLPPPEEQRRIVAEVEERLSVIDAMQASIERAERRSAALRRSILERAFRGELAPQDPSDEPATVLLERIRAVRAAATLSSGGR